MYTVTRNRPAGTFNRIVPQSTLTVPGPACTEPTQPGLFWMALPMLTSPIIVQNGTYTVAKRKGPPRIHAAAIKERW